jgi:competence protein ComEA
MKRALFAILVAFTLVCAFSFSVYASTTDAIVNINTASSKELSSLKKIGKKVSLRIIEYRENVGPFEKPQDIMKVKGISNKIFELNKDRIVVRNEAVSTNS